MHILIANLHKDAAGFCEKVAGYYEPVAQIAR